MNFMKPLSPVRHFWGAVSVEQSGELEKYEGASHAFHPLSDRNG
jgi:hypothetical protein